MLGWIPILKSTMFIPIKSVLKNHLKKNWMQKFLIYCQKTNGNMQYQREHASYFVGEMILIEINNIMGNKSLKKYNKAICSDYILIIHYHFGRYIKQII